MRRTGIRLLLLAAVVVAALVVVLVGWDRGSSSRGGAWSRCDTEEVVAAPETVDRPALEGITTRALVSADQPTALAFSPADGAMFVGERAGRILRRGPDEADATMVLDLSADVTNEGERGMLSLAVAPDGSRLFVHRSDRAGRNLVEEYSIADSGEIDRGSRRELLGLDHPTIWHYGGTLTFGPDGYLYIALGDGGDHAPTPDPEDDAQRLDSLFGKILRVDPTPTADAPYTIPPDNPFVATEGARGEIWLRGLRNPWRFTFDRETGDLWIADAGQFCYEEIDRVPPDSAGANLGWNRVEGTRRVEGDVPSDLLWPAYVYDHPRAVERQGPLGSVVGCAVVGGDLYRGASAPELQGGYVFSDYCNPTLWLVRPGAEAVEVTPLGSQLSSVLSFGTGLDGELYVLTEDAVEQIVSESPSVSGP